LQFKRWQPRHRHKNHQPGIRASAPLQIIHADVTEFRLQDNQRVYIYAVVDNFSRALLHLHTHTHKKALYLFEGLQAVHTRFLQQSHINCCTLMTDDGSENYGPVQELVTTAQNPALQHVIAQLDIGFSNSMVEHAHKELKYQWLYHHSITSTEQLNQLLAQHLVQNNGRPRAVLCGLTPDEVLAGQMPVKNLHATAIQKAAKARIIENKKTKCCSVSF
jgi:putative transposase